MPQALPIVQGLKYAIRMTVVGPVAPFPLGAELRADLRHLRGSRLYGSLTTENGGLTRINDYVVDIAIDALTTFEMDFGTVMLDFIRLDDDGSKYLYIVAKFSVVEPVTKVFQ